MRALLRRFRADLRAPLPGTAGLGRGARLRARWAWLSRRYGWRLLAGLVLYYLVRDSLLYLLLPWLAARQLLD